MSLYARLHGLKKQVEQRRTQSSSTDQPQRGSKTPGDLAAGPWHLVAEHCYYRTTCVPLGAEYGPLGPWCQYFGPWFRLSDSFGTIIQRGYSGDEQALIPLFFDLETTGLGGVAGTVAFLLGWARFHPQDPKLVEVHQWFADDFPGEAQVVKRFFQSLPPKAVLVGFNSRSFDLPLIRSRAAMASVAPEGREGEQLWDLDLLSHCRRWWRGRLERYSLGTLEDEILGTGRAMDFPSALIPDRYFEHQRIGGPPEAGDMEWICAHHLEDMVSLARILTQGATLLAWLWGAGPLPPRKLWPFSAVGVARSAVWAQRKAIWPQGRGPVATMVEYLTTAPDLMDGMMSDWETGVEYLIPLLGPLGFASQAEPLVSMYLANYTKKGEHPRWKLTRAVSIFYDYHLKVPTKALKILEEFQSRWEGDNGSKDELIVELEKRIKRLRSRLGPLQPS